ncbi:MAG: phosphoserine phosphatase SerB [Trebonia sp.]|jgi:phosphoserine phosphatase|uniref:phosphoserine phosphatase SerB n=1 Tax=Trebonia sp. TaxID=2767075 RepID=UPI003BAE59F5
MNEPRTTLLITLTGRDRPGVTSRLFSVLARFPLSVVDIEQVVIRGRLVLGVLTSCDEPPDLTAIHRSVTSMAAGLGLDAEITTGSAEPGQGGAGYGAAAEQLHVTVLGHPLQPDAVAAVAGRIAASGANIDRITRLASDPVTCIELDVSGAEPGPLRAALAQVAADSGVDVAVQRGGLHRRAMRLIVMDVDSTLIQEEVIDLLAARAGCADEVAKITESAMRGELDFAASLRERTALLAGLDASVLDAVRASLRLTPGARTLIRTLKRLGYKCGIVSGGFTAVIEPLAASLGIDYVAANTLEVADGKLTGRVLDPVIDREGKTEALRRFARTAGVPLSQTVAVGDGANDLGMIAAAGLGIAFNAKPMVRDAADTALSVPYLDTVLYLLGISRDAVAAAENDTSPDL